MNCYCFKLPVGKFNRVFYFSVISILCFDALYFLSILKRQYCPGFADQKMRSKTHSRLELANGASLLVPEHVLHRQFEGASRTLQDGGMAPVSVAEHRPLPG